VYSPAFQGYFQEEVLILTVLLWVHAKSRTPAGLQLLQLNKLIDVIKVSDITDYEHVSREIALIKVNAESGSSRAEVMQIATTFRAKIIDVGTKTVILEVTGNSDKIDALEKLLRQYGVREFVRTGRIAIMRGSKTISVPK